MNPNVSVHVAILSRPYLDLLLIAAKTVESRFAADRRAPYKKIDAGDVLLLKQVGGPICGIALAKKVFFYEITPRRFGAIKTNFGPDLKIDDMDLWARYKKASYATLIRVDQVRKIDPITYIKRDQRAWVTFQSEAPTLTV